jgi:hypothetical protein
MGASGRHRIEQELAWKYSVKNLIAAYERAFEKRSDYSAARIIAET